MLLIGAVAVPSCSESKDGAPGAQSRKAKRVVLIVCDTLRPDRLGCYGNPRGLSPNVDAFADSATVYERAYAHSAMTMPSMAALLSGRTVDEIGVGRGNTWNLAESVITVAESIEAIDVATAAVVSNSVLQAPNPEIIGTRGIAQGFEHYDDVLPAAVMNRAHKERIAPETTEAALAHVDSLVAAGTDEFFLWVHFIDPHGPYTPPEPYKSRFERETSTREGAKTLPFGQFQGGTGEIPAYQVLGDEDRIDVYIDRYDAEVAFFDKSFGALMDGLTERGLADETLFVFTADHGEALGEHNQWFSHGHTLAAHNVHVPLIVRFPRNSEGAFEAPAPGSWPEIVQHIDVSSTILDAFGLRRSGDPRRTLFSLKDDANSGAIHQLGFPGEGKRYRGIAKGEWHLVQREGARPRLFNLTEDPSESRDRFRDAPLIAEQLIEAYEDETERLESEPIPAVPDDPRDEARRKQLSGLGYGPGDDR